MNSTTTRLFTALTLALALLCGLLLVMGLTRPTAAVLAQGTIRYVAPTGNDSANECTNSSTPCATVQYAVDVSNPGDEIRVATGVYTGVQTRPRKDIETTGLVTQVVYISQTIAIRGGYTPTNWTISDPEMNPTLLDAQGQGRVLYITGDIDATIEGLQLSNGRADHGGGVFVITATTTFNNNTISNNAVNQYGWGGGMIFVSTPRSTLVDNTISNNHADGDGLGGGVAFGKSVNITLIGNTIGENELHTGLGGGIVLSESANATLISNTIISNRSLGGPCLPNCSHAGGLYIVSSNNLTLTANVITNNVASQTGGGMSFDSCQNVNLTANLISNNNASDGGGGRIVNSNNVNLTDNLFSDNYAAGAGITTGGGGLQILNSTELELTNNIFRHNGASIAGGGASFVNSSQVVLRGNTIIDHTQGNFIIYGAGLHFLNTTNALLISNTITNNGPVTFGGGLYLDASDILLINNVIADNRVRDVGGPGRGSGLYISGSSSQLLHNTIARNSGGDNSGLLITGTNSTVAMTNTILVSHTVGLTITAGNTATLNGVLWYDNLTNTAGDGTVTVTNAYTGDPFFHDPTAGDYHLSPGSAALDRGLNAGVTEDIDGDPRPMGLGYDLGADELRVGLVVTKEDFPDPVLAGSQLTYTIRVTNTGDMPLSATITDILPASVTPIGPLVWPPTTIAPAEVWIKQIVVLVAADSPETLTNVVRVTTTEGPTGTFTETTTVLLPLTDVTITGPSTGLVNTDYTFYAQITPVAATQPLTYTWSPQPDNGQGTANVTYNWPETGAKTINITALNVSATVVDTHLITISSWPWCPKAGLNYCHYLPVIIYSSTITSTIR